MNRYTRAALAGWRNPRESAFTAPDWIRLSNACRAAFEIGAYFHRNDLPAPNLSYAGGRKAPRFTANGAHDLSVWQEYPGVIIKAGDGSRLSAGFRPA